MCRFSIQPARLRPFPVHLLPFLYRCRVHWAAQRRQSANDACLKAEMDGWFDSGDNDPAHAPLSSTWALTVNTVHSGAYSPVPTLVCQQYNAQWIQTLQIWISGAFSVEIVHSHLTCSVFSHLPCSVFPVSRVPCSPAFRVPCSPISRVPCPPTSCVPCSPASRVPCSPTSRVPCSPASRVPCSATSRVPCSPTSYVPCSPASRRYFLCRVPVACGRQLREFVNARHPSNLAVWKLIRMEACDMTNYLVGIFQDALHLCPQMCVPVLGVANCYSFPFMTIMLTNIRIESCRPWY